MCVYIFIVILCCWRHSIIRSFKTSFLSRSSQAQAQLEFWNILHLPGGPPAPGHVSQKFHQKLIVSIQVSNTIQTAVSWFSVAKLIWSNLVISSLLYLFFFLLIFIQKHTISFSRIYIFKSILYNNYNKCYDRHRGGRCAW